jgi:hypothetical protein
MLLSMVVEEIQKIRDRILEVDAEFAWVTCAAMLSEARRSKVRFLDSTRLRFFNYAPPLLHHRFRTLNDPYHNDRYQSNYRTVLFQSFHTCNKKFFFFFWIICVIFGQ